MIRKAGVVLAAAFTGTPKTASVAFGTVFPDTGFAVTVDAVTTGGTVYLPVVESKAVGGFTVNLGTDDDSDLTEVGWQAFQNES